jgi:hypothetical protein
MKASDFKPQADAQYQKLMSKYKQLRRNPDKRELAIQYLREAQDLDRQGEVSPEVVTAWQYLG